MSAPVRWLIIGVLCLLGAASWAQTPGERIMATVEQRLRDAEFVRLYAYVTVEEPYRRKLSGQMEIDGDSLEARFHGNLDQDAVDLSLRREAQSLSFSVNGDAGVAEAGQHWREALLIGALRMGVSHNLFRVARKEAPEFLDGSLDERVQLRNVRYREGSQLRGYQEGEIALQFDVEVDGKRAGYARLWLSTQTGMPIRREQFWDYVDAEGRRGQMLVEENYTTFLTEAGDQAPTVQE